MEYPFDALHAGIESQILNLPAGIPNSQAIRQAKSLPDSVEKFCALGRLFPGSFVTGRPLMPIRRG